MKKQYKAVIFDLDGTLLNTLEDLQAAVNYTMSKLNVPLRSLDEVRSFVGNGIRKLLERSLPQNGQTQETLDRAYEIFCSYYDEHNADRTVAYAGMVEFIQTLKQRNVGMGVVTNKADFAAQKLCRVFFKEDTFDCVIGAREDLRRKPNPDGVFEALRKMKTSASDAVYVGDSDVDFYTAANAGVDCVLVTWGFREKTLLKKLQPSATVKDVRELEKFIFGE